MAQTRDRPTEQTILTEEENGTNQIQTSEESYGASELKIMKRQFMGLLRGFAVWYVLVLILSIIAVLAAKFLC